MTPPLIPSVRALRPLAPLCLGLLFLLSPSPSLGVAQGSSQQTIRLLLKEEVPRITVKGMDLKVYNQARSLRFEGEGMTTLVLTPGKGGIKVDGLVLAPGAVVIKSPAGYLWVDGAEEHGSLTLIPGSPSPALPLPPMNVVLNLGIDAYLPGLLLGEVPPTWPDAAIEAQAIAARSYAISRMEETKDKDFDLYSTTQDQVYGGGGNIPFRLFGAVSRTKGQVLMNQGEVLRAYYHSSCGGQTEQPRNVWPKAKPVPRGGECIHCKGAPGYSWTLKLSPEEVQNRLQAIDVDVGIPERITPEEMSPAGRWVQVRVIGPKGEAVVFGNRFREALGYGSLKSLRFELSKAKGEFHFSGTGYGHGVGMCQWGMKAMASGGSSAEEILRYYYPQSTLTPKAGGAPITPEQILPQPR